MNVLAERDREAVRDVLAGLEREVSVRLVLGPEETAVTVIVGGGDIDFRAETQAHAGAVPEAAFVQRLLAADPEPAT